MTRTFIIFLTIFCSTLTLTIAQTMTFDSAVKSLYFEVDIIKAENSIVDSFMKVPQLHHNDKVVRQSNLNLYIQLNTKKEAWSSKHVFTFNESPLPSLKIDSGYIEVNIGEAEGIKKMLALNWYLQFDSKTDAIKYFEKIKELFSGLSTIKKFEYDRDVGHIAQFSTRKQTDKGIRDITLFLYKSLQTKKYEISLLLGNELMDK